MQRLQNPFPMFFDSRGLPLDAGFIYVGETGEDPEASPLDLYSNEDLSVPLAQPLRTLVGLVVDGSNPTFVYLDESDYSIKVTDADGHQVFYIASTSLLTVTYQPQDAALDALSGAPTAAYGIALLAIANQAALQAAVGLPAALALTGGTVSGNIVRSGAGTHLYHVDAALTSGRVFVTAAGASDPTSLSGDIWLEAE